MAVKHVVYDRSYKISDILFENIKARSSLNFSVQFILFNDDLRKESIFEEAVVNFKMRNIICVPCRVWSV